MKKAARAGTRAEFMGGNMAPRNTAAGRCSALPSTGGAVTGEWNQVNSENEIMLHRFRAVPTHQARCSPAEV